MRGCILRVCRAAAASATIQRGSVSRVEGHAVGRIKCRSRGVDVGTGQFAFLDAAADGEGVGGIGTEVDDGGEIRG